MIYSDILKVLEKAGSDGHHLAGIMHHPGSTAAQLTSRESNRQGPL